MTGFKFRQNSFLILFSFFFLYSGFNKPQKHRGDIIFSHKLHNFGVIQEGNIVSYTYKFKNTSKRDVRINSANAACICTSISFPHKKIKPGKIGSIKVTFNSSKLPGKFKKRIVISLNSKPYTIALYIKGLVLPKPLKGKEVTHIGHLTFSNDIIHLGKIPVGIRSGKIIKIQNPSSETISIKSVKKPEKVNVTYPKFKIMTGERFKIGISFKPDSEQINHRIYKPITFYTTDTLKPKKVVYLSCLVVRSAKKVIKGPVIRFKKSLINGGNVIQGDTLRTSFQFENIGNKSLSIQKLIPSCGCTTAKIKKNNYTPGEKGIIHVKINTNGKFGFIKKEIKVISDASNQPQYLLTIQFNVVQHPSPKKMLNEIASNKILIFQGKCRSCHVDRGIGEKGAALFDASCQMCHGNVNRKKRAYYPGPSLDSKLLKSLSGKQLYYLIADGTPDVKEKQMMPGFLNRNGGPLTKKQVISLVKYLKSIQ